MKKVKGKRILSLVMAVALALGMLPADALANNSATSAQQIATSYIANQTDGMQTAKLANSTKVTSNDKMVTIDKTITGTETENEFDITLDISTKEELKQLEISPDAAVVVVLDTSVSMQWDLDGGGYATGFNYDGNRHDNCGKYDVDRDDYIDDADVEHDSGNDVYANGKDPDPDNWLKGSRIEAATDAINQFIDGYVKDAGTAKRYFSLVDFSHEAQTPLGWKNLTEGQNAANAKATVSSLCSSGNQYNRLEPGTNIHDGLLTAQQLVKTMREENQIENCYIILLTDGAPNRHMEGNKPSKDGDHEDATARTAAEILEDTTLYAIAYSNDVTSVNWLDDYNENTKNFIAYDSSQTGKLDTIFESIVTQITNYAKAWTVTDPMGKYMHFLGFYQKDGTLVNGVYSEKQASESNGTIIWDLKHDTTVEETSSNNSTDYTYTLRYRIRFDNVAALQQQAVLQQNRTNTEFATNGKTYLKYYTNAEQLEHLESMPTLYFNYPTVKSNTGNFSFNKEDRYIEDVKFGYRTEGNGSLQNAATFTLTHACGGSCSTNWSAVSYTMHNRVDFSNIPSGHTYTMTEQVPDGYNQSKAEVYTVTVSWGQVTVTDSNGDTVYSASKPMTVYNELDPAEQTLTVNKTWLGGDPADGTTITVTVTGNNESGSTVYTRELTITKQNHWSASITVPTVDVKTGEEITYTIEEQSVAGWKQVSGTSNGLTFTLENAREQYVTYSVKKQWIGPAADWQEVTAYLMNGDSEVGSVTLNSTNGWSAEFDPVDTYDNSGNLIDYTVVEAINGQKVDNTFTVNSHNYTAEVELSGNAFTIRNTIAQDNSVSITGTKTWKVGTLTNAAATFTLLADGQPTGKTVILQQNEVSIQFTDLPKYALPNTVVGTVTYPAAADGHQIVYTIQETESTGAPAGDNIASSNDGNNHFTNTLTGTTSVTVHKVWVDNDDAEGLRPESITIRLMNGNNVVQSATLRATYHDAVPGTSDNPETEDVDESTPGTPAYYEWTDADLTYTFTGLPKYDANGNTIVYTVTEETVTNYDSAVSSSAADGFTITNTLNPETTTLTVSKVWVDTAESHGDVTVNILANGTFYQSVVLSESDGWTATVTLPKRANGTVIDYTVQEANVPGGYTVNVVEGADNHFTVFNVIDQNHTVFITGTKTWVGGSDAHRPELTFTLWADGKATSHVIRSTDEGYDPANITFSGLNKYAYTYDEKGQAVGCREIQYSIVETMTGALADRYTSSVQVSAEGVYNFTNTFNPGTTRVTGTKVWVDGGKTTHSPITVGLFEKGASQPVTITTTIGGNFAFENLPAYNVDGTPKSYVVYEMSDGAILQQGDEIVVDGNAYVVTYTTGTITNTLKQETISVPVTKVWQGPAAESVTFELYQNSTRIDTLTLTAADAQANGTWTGSFTGLDKYDSSRAPYTYTVKEAEVEGYTVRQEGGNTFINTVEQTATSLTAVKEWIVPADGSVTLPEAVEIQLYADGVPYAVEPADGQTDYTKSVQITAENDWTYTFEHLSKYAYTYDADENVASVREIIYTVAEVGGTRSGEAYTVQIGHDHYKISYGANEAGQYVITNDYIRTDVFGYRVIRNYFTITDGVRGQAIVVGDPAPILGKQSDSITVDPTGYTSHDGTAYSFQGGMIDGVRTEQFTFTLEAVNHIYVVVLNYERTVTTNPGDGGGTVTPKPDPDEEVEIPDPETPLDPGPEEEVDIPEEETPLNPAPEEEIGEEDVPLAPAPEETIADGNVPLANLPQTGAAMTTVNPVIAATTLTLAAALTAAGVVCTIGRKKEDDPQ